MQQILGSNAPQRMNALVGIPALLDEYGVKLQDALEGIAIDPRAFDDQDYRIPYSLGGRLLERCATLTGCSYFGLLLGSRYDHRALGFPGEFMANSPNLGAALTGFVSLQHSNSRGASAYLHQAGDCWVLGYGIYEPDTVGRDDIYALSVALMLNAIRSLTGGAAEPNEILFSIRKPSEVGQYAALLRHSHVRFDELQTALVFPRSALDTPIQGAQPSELERLKKLALAASPASDTAWTDRVKHAMRPLLLQGEPTSATMAAFLGVSKRTLYRHLEAEGASFQPLLDQVRYGMARELLTITELSISEIADALAYSSHSHFTGAFRRWSGATPSEWRAALRIGAEAGYEFQSPTRFSKPSA